MVFAMTTCSNNKPICISKNVERVGRGHSATEIGRGDRIASQRSNFNDTRLTLNWNLTHHFYLKAMTHFACEKKVHTGAPTHAQVGDPLRLISICTGRVVAPRSGRLSVILRDLIRGKQVPHVHVRQERRSTKIIRMVGRYEIVALVKVNQADTSTLHSPDCLLPTLPSHSHVFSSSPSRFSIWISFTRSPRCTISNRVRAGRQKYKTTLTIRCANAFFFFSCLAFLPWWCALEVAQTSSLLICPYSRQDVHVSTTQNLTRPEYKNVLSGLGGASIGMTWA